MKMSNKSCRCFSHTLAIIVFCMGALFCAGKETISVQIVKTRGYDSQDALRDSLRFALYRASDHGLSFWAREYPLNEDFFSRGEIRKIAVLPGRPRLCYKLWLHAGKAPLVALLPGMGSHFQGAGLNAMAQTYSDAGYSVVVISSAMNWEFYLAASRSKAPGYSPFDAEDVRHALRKIIADIKERYPGRVASLHLAGYSLGGIHTLFIAEMESKVENENKIGFDSYLAIHPPVGMHVSMSALDAFFDDWREWPEKEVSLRMARAAAAYLALVENGLPKNKRIDVSRRGAKFLIALSYRYALRELLLAIREVRNDMGLIKTEYGFRKNDLYREIDGVTFELYAEKFVRKSTSERLGKDISMKEMAESSGLRRLEPFLAKAANVRLIQTLDDFLVRKNDLKWFAETFRDRAFFFEHGGHLGELYTPEAKQALVECLKLGSKAGGR